MTTTNTAVCNDRGIAPYLRQIVIAPLQGHIRRNSSGRVDVRRSANLGASVQHNPLRKDSIEHNPK